jgi:hypothetical protein
VSRPDLRESGKKDRGAPSYEEALRLSPGTETFEDALKRVN